MLIKVKRVDWTSKGLFGHLTLDWSKFECVTLERHDIAVPVGRYPVTLYESPSNHCMVPLLHDIPGRDMIEIHCGNWETDSKGCILVGSRRVGSTIESSKVAFNALMKELQGAKGLWIEIS